MPESSTIQQAARTIVTSTTSIQPKKILTPGPGVVSVKVEPMGNGDPGAKLASAAVGGARLVQLVAAGSILERQPNILKRGGKPTTITLAPKRPLLASTVSAPTVGTTVVTSGSATTFVATIPSPPSSTSSANSDNGSQQEAALTPKQAAASSSTISASSDFDKSPLSLLAEEAARRTPTLNLGPCLSSDVPLDPKFIGGPIIAGKEQIDIRKSEIVCQQLSEHKLNGPYVVLIAHSHREYRGTMIKAENFEGFKEDNDNVRRWPLRAWTDSAYNETTYTLLDIPKLGTHPVAIVTLKDENVINLRFPVLSSDRNNHGHKKFGRLWEEIIFPFDKVKTAYLHWHITPIQIVAELRDPNKLKKPKRPDLISQTMAMPLPYRTNPSDLAVGSPLGYAYEASDDEDSRHPKFMDIKREPMEDSEHSFANVNPDEMTKDQQIAATMENFRQLGDLMRSMSPEMVRWLLDESKSKLKMAEKQVERNQQLQVQQQQETHRLLACTTPKYENGT